MSDKENLKFTKPQTSDKLYRKKASLSSWRWANSECDISQPHLHNNSRNAHMKYTHR